MSIPGVVFLEVNDVGVGVGPVFLWERGLHQALGLRAALLGGDAIAAGALRAPDLASLNN